MKETERMKKSFELYAALGEDRNYAKVSELTGIPLRSIERWGSEFKWQEKLEKKEREQKEKYRAQYEKLAELQLKIKTTCAEKYLEYIESKSKISDYKEYMSIVGTDIDLNFLGLVNSPSGVEEQSACATSNTVDTPETKSVIAQIETSLQALGGEEDD